ncbi:hypothetical protein M422DRAFT_63164 [Sphaerobolus stellatus SS14]|nr:hypothetical protein M422DRAFT_63164 [Sphaerobolus stellatus SS14]
MRKSRHNRRSETDTSRGFHYTNTRYNSNHGHTPTMNTPHHFVEEPSSMVTGPGEPSSLSMPNLSYETRRPFTSGGPQHAHTIDYPSESTTNLPSAPHIPLSQHSDRHTTTAGPSWPHASAAPAPQQQRYSDNMGHAFSDRRSQTDAPRGTDYTHAANANRGHRPTRDSTHIPFEQSYPMIPGQGGPSSPTMPNPSHEARHPFASGGPQHAHIIGYPPGSATVHMPSPQTYGRYEHPSAAGISSSSPATYASADSPPQQQQYSDNMGLAYSASGSRRRQTEPPRGTDYTHTTNANRGHMDSYIQFEQPSPTFPGRGGPALSMPMPSPHQADSHRTSEGYTHLNHTPTSHHPWQ